MVRARLYGKDEATLTLYSELSLIAKKRPGSRHDPYRTLL